MATTAAVSGSNLVTDSLISAAESDRIDALPLPLLERQRLRLLAHSLRSLQAAAGRCDGPLPTAAELQQWAQGQPQLAAEDDFRALLIQQLLAAGLQLQHLGEQLQPPQPALGLSLEQLLAAAAPAAAHQQNPTDPPTNPPNPVDPPPAS